MSSFFSITGILLFLLAFALMSCFFSLSETSIIGLSKIRLRHMVAKGIRRAKHIQKIVDNLDDFIVAILVGNNFVNIAISAIITVLFVRILGDNWGLVAATLVTTLLVLIFCEITPKIIALKYTERVALFVAPAMVVFIKAILPVVRIFTRISNVIVGFFRIKGVKRSPLITEEELRMMVELGKEEGFLTEDEGKMLHRIFEFGDILVKDIMIPRDKMTAININTSPEELLNIFVEQGHSRLPVYSGSVDKIVGIVYARDLLYILRDKGLFVLSDLLQKAYFTLDQTPVHELLKTFQKDRLQIAIIVDKAGKTLGLVTLEDLIEEIVGEIEEEQAVLGSNKH